MWSQARRLEVIVLFTAFLLVNLAGALFQKTISYHNGKGWEADSYYQTARQFARGEAITGEAPMVFRVGAPFLAARLSPRNLTRGFRIVDVTANALGLVLLVAWLRLYLDNWKTRVILGLLYLLEWDAPNRWIWFFPVHTDPCLWVFLLAGLITAHHLQEAGVAARWPLVFLCGTSFVGVLFREVSLLVPIVVLFARNPVARVDGVGETPRVLRLPPPVFFLPLVCGLAGWLFVRMHVTVTGDYSFVWTAQHWAYSKSPPELAHSWLLAFGPVLFLVIYDWRHAGSFLAGHQFLLVYGLGMAVCGYMGGSDTERLSYWSMPVVYVLLGRALERHRALLRCAPLAGFLAGAQLLSARAFWVIPDFPNDHPARSIPLFTQGMGSHFAFLDLFTYSGARLPELISLVEYLVFGLVLFLWLGARRRRLAARAGDDP